MSESTPDKGSLFDELAKLSPEQRARFEKRLAEKGLATGATRTAVARRDPDATIPLSFAQQRLWFVQQFDPENSAYNAGSAMRLGGPLDVAALERALGTIVARHESLRTCFVPGASGQPEQRIEPPKPPDLPCIDLSGRPLESETVRTAVRERLAAPFDLEAPPLRFALVRTGPEEHLLVVVTHHIISDRWSVSVFLRELVTLYHADVQGNEAELAELPVQYADWAAWQREQLEGDRLEGLIDYWTTRLEGPLPMVELPTDRSLPSVATNAGAQLPLLFDTELVAGLKQLAAARRVSLFVLLLAGFKALLHHYSQATDVIVGSEVANRDRPETANLIGLLVNTLVLRTDLSGDPAFSTLLDRVKDTVLGGLQHQDLPFEKLVEVLNPDRQLDQLTPLFQAKFDLQQMPLRDIQFEGLSLERYTVEETQTKYPLRFNLQDGGDAINGQIEYSTDLFDAETIERIGGHYRTLLRAIVEDPERRLSTLPLMDRVELEATLGRIEVLDANEPPATLPQLFRAQAKRTPDALAVTDGDRRFTYRALDQASDRLAGQLRARGVEAEAPVGVCMRRSSDLILALLGVLKAGGAYVPLDPEYPAGRLGYIVDDAGLDLVLGDEATPPIEAERAYEKLDVRALQAATSEGVLPAIDPDQLAYIIYTSGSTGKPKGVAIEHRQTVAMVRWARSVFDKDALTGVLASTSVCFDLSVFEIFVPLAWGGAIVLADGLSALARHPERDRVTLVNTVPSLLRQFLDDHALPAQVSVVNLAGEALPAALVEALHAHETVRHVFNLYGPSEDTTYSTIADLSPGVFDPTQETVHIGRPIADTSALIVDDQDRPLPIGVAGELLLGGRGLARGYFERDALTKERFVANPIANDPLTEAFDLPDRYYRTGDRVVRRADGRLEFQGRFDHQIKVRGFRVEAGEVEAELRRHPGIAEVLVVAHRDASEQMELLAWVVPRPGEGGAVEIAPASLRAWLIDRLPSPMVPTKWQTIEAIPRLPNGKVDHRDLPDPDLQEETRAYEAPSTETEHTLAGIWQALVGQDAVGIHDDFFALGGHSLMAIEMIALIEDRLGRRIALRALFEAPTVAALAARIDATPPATTGDSDRLVLEADPSGAHAPFPLTPIQQAYWLGRNGVFELGNVATHGYREIDVRGLSFEAIVDALQCLVARHGMLRAVISDDGQQQVLAEVPRLEVPRADLRGLDEAVRETRLSETRERLSHEVFALDTWPLFRVEAAQLDEDTTRFFVSFDVVIGDAASLQILGRDMARALAGQTLPPLSLGFRDYVLAERAFRETEAFARSAVFWEEKLPLLPPAPDLPLQKAPSEIDQPVFRRRSAQLPAPQWQALKRASRAAGLSVSAIALAAFSEVLALFSRRNDLTLNLTLFNRAAGHAEVNELIGDFTSSLLLGIDVGATEDFLDHARGIQRDLWEALEHRAVSGVENLRTLARREHRADGALMPVVFTSTLGTEMKTLRPGDWTADVHFGVSQTSQVYLDHQISEIDDALHINWDTIDELFPPGVLDEMFAAYRSRLETLSEGEGAWREKLARPAGTVAAHAGYLAELNEPTWQDTGAESILLHELFFRQAERMPDAIAIEDGETRLDYRELAARALALAAELRRHDCQPNELIAISLRKGWRQVVAALGIQAAGSAYVPIDPDLPATRRRELVRDTQARLVVSFLEDWPEDVERLALSDALPEGALSALATLDPGARRIEATDLAYVIYTSGSTGMPKGVMIDHRGAVNTIVDINRRLDLGPKDRVFALSSLSFDLSVYDLFGPLAVGAAIVFPDYAHAMEPDHWIERLAAGGVTVWNSVPALMQILVTELECRSDAPALSLRAAMLSGDWIPLALPERIATQLPSVRTWSLGGATEASIWSIFHPIERLDPNWPSIPYGRPLTNQSFYVLDESMNPCPPWVTGELYIGGVGVARGYWRRPGLSAERFVPNPFSAKEGDWDAVLYRTGDLGRFRPDGNIEFLGREDQQVKVNGHRIELGEIETVLAEHAALRDAVVTTWGTPPQLVAYVVPALDADDESPLQKLGRKEAARSQRHAHDDARAISLPLPKNLASFRRQSHRVFEDGPVALEAFAEWLSVLRATEVPGAPTDKYRYPSAGSLYPVHVLAHVPEGGVTGLAAGWYRYEAQGHRLLPVDGPPALDPASLETVFSANAEVARGSAFQLFLIGDLSLIEPVYGERARDFCLLEAGYQSQLLMEEAPGQDLGLCPLNDPGFATLPDLARLDEDHVVLHALVGGRIRPEWSDRWRLLEDLDERSFMDRLKDALRERLPAYMVPTRLLLLPELPLNANGKVDRKRLPAPESEGAAAVYRAPTTDLERKVVDFWASLLETPHVGLDDNYFELGGNSVLAIQLLSSLRELGAESLAIADLFGAHTPGEQAALIEERLAPGETPSAEPEAIQRVAREAEDSIEDLSNDDVDAMLKSLLAEGTTLDDDGTGSS
ncbi:MAG: non-ribosomal peptide synthetase [Deltaproteobacteria bacterium]|nr:non-ribosomal peptide synthetase [Deltaproteobacteria bacterium]